MDKIFSNFVYTASLLFTVFMGGLMFPSAGLASCGSSNCFLGVGTQDGVIVPGQVILDLSYRFIPMDRVQEGSKSASEALVPRIDFENGEIIQDGPSGFGDIRLIGKYTFHAGTRHLFVGGLGVKAPTGEYKLLDHDGEINEPTIMPGTGSWDGLVSAYYSHQVLPRRLEAFFSASYQVTTENDLDYQFGNTLLINGGAGYLFSFQDKPVTTTLQLNMRQSPRDEFKGDEVPSTGGRWIYITPGIRLQASADTAVYVHVQMPVYQYVNDENIVPRYGLLLGISRSF